MSNEKAGQLLEIWKTNVELHIFHDNLKQERIKRFTAVQIVIAAGYSLTVRLIPTAEANLVFLYAAQALCACLAGTIYSSAMIDLDRRAAEFVRTVKNQIQHVELALNEHFPELKYMPYQGQRLVLSNPPQASLSVAGEYLPTTGVSTKTAAGREAVLIRLVNIGWFIAIFATVALTAHRYSPLDGFSFVLKRYLDPHTVG